MPVFVLALLSFPPMAAQFAATKIGVQAGLTAWDIAAFRYGAAALGALLVLADPKRRAIMLAAPTPLPCRRASRGCLLRRDLHDRDHHDAGKP